MTEEERKQGIECLLSARTDIVRASDIVSKSMPEGRARQVLTGALYASRVTIQSVEDALKMMEPK